MTDAELVLASYHAYARGDIEQAAAPLDPDVDWVEPETFPNGGRHRGRDVGMQAFADPADAFDAFPDGPDRRPLEGAGPSL